MDDPEFLLNRGTVGLTQYGNDAKEFARETLAPLIKPGMTVYEELKGAIFGGARIKGCVKKEATYLSAEI